MMMTFDYSVGGDGDAATRNNYITDYMGYQGLSEETIAQMPLEDLYRRIDRNMSKTNSFFDLRLSHAIKQ